jgi:hypothetical protein
VYSPCQLDPRCFIHRKCSLDLPATCSSIAYTHLPPEHPLPTCCSCLAILPRSPAATNCAGTSAFSQVCCTSATPPITHLELVFCCICRCLTERHRRGGGLWESGDKWLCHTHPAISRLRNCSKHAAHHQAGRRCKSPPPLRRVFPLGFLLHWLQSNQATSPQAPATLLSTELPCIAGGSFRLRVLLRWLRRSQGVTPPPPRLAPRLARDYAHMHTRVHFPPSPPLLLQVFTLGFEYLLHWLRHYLMKKQKMGLLSALNKFCSGGWSSGAGVGIGAAGGGGGSACVRACVRGGGCVIGGGEVGRGGGCSCSCWLL